MFTVPSLVLYSDTSLPIQTVESYEQVEKLINSHILTYDELLNLINAIEKGSVEATCSQKDLEKIQRLIINLALKGKLPNEDPAVLEKDIEELLATSDEEDLSYCPLSSNEAGSYFIMPAIAYSHGDMILCKSWLSKRWKHVRHFIKKHKKAIIIGAVVLVAATVIIACVAASASAAGAAAGAGAAALSDEEKKSKENAAKAKYDEIVENAEALQPNIDQQISDFKECILNEGLLDSELPFEENARILGQAWAYQNSDDILQQSSKLYQELTAMNSSDQPGNTKGAIDLAFAPNDNNTFFPNYASGKDFKENVYEWRGERALELKYYDQAISDFNKAINLNPDNNDTYLNRATAYLESGDYENSVYDYEYYQAKNSSSFDKAVDFTAGFAKGFANGVQESGKQLGEFAINTVLHPIDTATEIGQGFYTLSKLAATQQWDSISQLLVPEARELAKNWNNLSDKEKGELAGKIVGKYGTDLLLPGAATKIASKSVSEIKDLAAACKSFQNAEKTLAFESACESGTKVGETLRMTAEEIKIANNKIKALEANGSISTIPLNKGSTGRTLPNSLQEKFAMEQAIATPGNGKIIKVTMTDPRWPKEEGWVKMSKEVNGVEIHYVLNTETGAVDDFKFIDPKIEPPKGKKGAKT